jgi:hypothetical protein
MTTFLQKSGHFLELGPISPLLVERVIRLAVKT